VTSIVDLERCPDCGASTQVYARECPRCGADLFAIKADYLRQIRDAGGMTPDAYEIALGTLREGAHPAEPPVSGERKQVNELTLADLDRSPVWEFAIDEEGEPGQTEETVRPRPDLERVDPAYGLFLLRARFEACDGSLFVGFLNVGDVRDAQPTIVTDSGAHVAFWFGLVKPKPGVLERAYASLGLASSALFPLRYEAIVPTREGTATGEIAGFAYYDRYPNVRVLT